MTAAESNAERDSIDSVVPTSWSRPWANEWCLDADADRISDMACQARFAWSEGPDQVPFRDMTDYPAN